MDFLLLIGWIVMALGAAGIAASKGRSGLGYFLLALLFPLIGLLIAIGVASKIPVQVAQPSEPKRKMRKCPACAELVLFDAKKCKHCGEVFPVSSLATLSAAPAAPAAQASTFAQLFPWIVLCSVAVIVAMILMVKK